MSRPVRLGLGLLAILVLAFGSVASTTAGGPKVLDARMVGIPTGGLVLQGVTGGGAPWFLDEGRAMLFADGRLHVEVDHLVLGNGTNPITQGRAIVTCAAAPAASSPIVPFSSAGDAEVDTVVSLPAPCLAPAVFFAGVLASGAERWFAVTGS
jgi:hypothetical protein